MTVTGRLMFVHAHPDDETIGNGATMAKYAAEGSRVTLVTCTAGEMGEILVPDLEHLAAHHEDGLGEHRRLELDAAMKALGVTDHRFLGEFGKYRDSGMKWHEDGHAIAMDETDPRAFANADLTAAADDLVAVIREVRPHVLCTYDQFGGYGHPDHIQAHRVAMYAAMLAGVASYRRELGEAWDIPKIYWNAMSWDRMRQGMKLMREQGDEMPFEGFDPDGPAPFFASAEEDISTEIDATPYAEAKLDALRAHETQVNVDGPFFALSNNLGSEVLGVEFYRLARGTAAGPGRETDLLAGLDPAN